MKEVLDDIERWHSAGHRAAIAHVVALEGSGPRDPGATMAVSDDGEVAGSVSGGCVEGAVVEAALEVLNGASREGRRHLRVLRRRGLRGRAHVRRHHPSVPRTSRLVAHVWQLSIQYSGLRRAAGCAARRRARGARHCHRRTEPRRQAARAACTGPWCSTVLGTLGDADLDRVVGRDALGELDAGLTSVRHYGEHGEAREDTVSVFIESFSPPPRMVIFGAVDFAATLAKVPRCSGTTWWSTTRARCSRQ